MNTKGNYIPALGHRLLTPLYDPLLRWGMREERFKRRLVEQAAIRGGQRVLDLGCGTGSLTILIKQMQPAADVVGLDGDPEVLAIGRAKADKAGVQIILDEGMSFQLPYPDNSFDRVLSSLVFHHLTHENKQRTLREVFRVLRPGGQLHIVDFGPPRGQFAPLLRIVMQRFEEAADNVKGLLPQMFGEAGFHEVGETGYHQTIVGGLSLYRASKPG